MTHRHALFLGIVGCCTLALPRTSTLAAPINWDNAAGGSWSLPGNWSPTTVPGGSDDAIFGLPGTYTVVETGNTAVNSIAINTAGATLWIQGSSAGGHTTLASAAGVSNNGTLLLESINSGFDSNLTLTTGVFANAGTIQANPGLGGSRTLTANVDNIGTINAATDAQLYIPASGRTFNQNAGSINGAGLFLMDNGLFNFNGGSTTGRVVLRGSQLQVHANAASPSTIIVTGSPTLIDNDATNVTVWVQGSLIGSHTSCGISNGATNAGTIRMESLDSGYHCTLAIAGDFTNTASGVIQVNPGTGGPRSITGHLINTGAVNVDSGTLLTIPNHYTAAGGTLNGPTHLVNAVLDETASPAGPTTIMTTGANATLTTDNLADTTLWIRGSNLGGHTTLTTPGAFANVGTLRMESVDAGYACNLALPTGAVTNSGTIQVNPGNGGDRIVTGGITNSGTISVANGIGLNVVATGRVVNQNAGSMTAPGQLIVDNGTFNFNGGSISGNVYLRNSQLNVAPTVTTPSTLFITGPTPSLVNNASPNVTVWVRGSQVGSHTVCSTIDGAMNAGTMRMESTEIGYSSNLAIAGSFTNTASGLIQVNNGTGGSRNISGHLINAGTVNVGSTTQLIIPDHYTAAGGTLNGPAYLVNAILDETASPANPTTIMTTGADAELNSDNLSNTTVWIRGSNLGGHTTLTTPGAFANAGTLRMESVEAGFACNLTLPTGALTNSGAIQVNPGAGGNRILTGGVTNTGTINVANGTSLSVVATDRVFNQNGGSIAVPGQFLMDNGAFNFNGGSTSGNVYLRNSQLDVAATVTTPSTVFITGPTPSLLNIASPSVTVWVQGNSFGGHTTLNAPNAFTNAGTLRLESINAGYACNVTLTGGPLANPGTIVVNAGAGGERDLTGDIDNTGTIQVGAGTTFDIIGNLLNNVGGTLATGQHTVAGTFDYTNALINTLEAGVTLDGPTSAIRNQSNANALANLATITSTGALSLKSGRNLSTGAAAFSNAGDLALSSASTLNITGSFTQAATGDLGVQIGGLAPGTNSARVTAGSALSLDGNLTVSRANNFAPAINDSIQIMVGSSRTGVFANVHQLEACGGRIYNIVYGATDVRLVGAASPFPLGDLNHDNQVNVADAVILAAVLSESDTDYLYQIRSDLNCDGQANGTDIHAFMDALLP